MSNLDSTLLSDQLVAGAVCAAAVLATAAAYYTLSSKNRKHDFPKLQGIQLYHAWNFFERRFDFLHSNLERNLQKGFSFDMLHHTVIALAGEEARQAFFSSPHLDVNEGYAILKGSVRASPPW